MTVDPEIGITLAADRVIGESETALIVLHTLRDYGDALEFEISYRLRRDVPGTLDWSTLTRPTDDGPQLGVSIDDSELVVQPPLKSRVEERWALFPAGGYGDGRHYQVECRTDLDVRPRRVRLCARWAEQAVEAGILEFALATP